MAKETALRRRLISKLSFCLVQGRPAFVSPLEQRPHYVKRYRNNVADYKVASFYVFLGTWKESYLVCYFIWVCVYEGRQLGRAIGAV